MYGPIEENEIREYILQKVRDTKFLNDILLPGMGDEFGNYGKIGREIIQREYRLLGEIHGVLGLFNKHFEDDEFCGLQKRIEVILDQRDRSIERILNLETKDSD